MEQHLINRIVEAALLAANQPLTAVQLQGLFPLDQPAPEGSIGKALTTLHADCETRGVELIEVASGWRYQVQQDVHEWVARLWTERQTRYTRATLETLALIAYRQPITRGEIEQVRGVSVNSNIIKALEEREWIRVVGHRDVPGRPELLGTTKGFLDYFGLKRLDELPPLSELKDFGELDPEFPFDRMDLDGMPVGDLAAAGEASDHRVAGAASAAIDDDLDRTSEEKGSESFSQKSTTEPVHPLSNKDSDPFTAKHEDGHGNDAADDTIDNQTEHDTALAEDGDSTGAKHE